LDGSTIGNSLTWRFAVEEVGYTLHDTGDPKSNHQEEQFSRTLALSIMDFTKGFLNRFEGAPEEVFAQFLETGTSEREVRKFDTMVETVNFDRGFEWQKKEFAWQSRKQCEDGKQHAHWTRYLSSVCV